MISLHYTSHTKAYNTIYTACSIVEAIYSFTCTKFFWTGHFPGPRWGAHNAPQTVVGWEGVSPHPPSPWCLHRLDLSPSPCNTSTFDHCTLVNGSCQILIADGQMNPVWVLHIASPAKWLGIVRNSVVRVESRTFSKRCQCVAGKLPYGMYHKYVIHTVATVCRILRLYCSLNWWNIFHAHYDPITFAFCQYVGYQNPLLWLYFWHAKIFWQILWVR